MKKLLNLTFLAMICSIASFALTPLSGTMTACVGATALIYEDSTFSGGTWSSSNPAVATVSTYSPVAGLVTSVSMGTCTITYTLGSSFVTSTFTVPGIIPAAISSPSPFCVGSTATFTDATPGGTWSTLTPTIVTINPSTGVATGLTSGMAQIKYTIGTGCFAYTTVNVLPGGTPSAISGPSTVCAGSYITLTDSVLGGSWSSSSTAIATVGTTGNVFGVSAGSVWITYTISSSCGSGYVVKNITVLSAPAAITGTATFCLGSTSTFADATPGGTWSSLSPAIVTINPTTGVATGVGLGYGTIQYMVGTTCPVTTSVNVLSTSGPDTIAGPSTLCTGLGMGITLTNSVAGGTWTSSNTSIATVGLYSGAVSGVSAGSVWITYTLSTPCGSGYVVKNITVTSGTSAGTISGPTSVAVGATITLTDGVAGGIWSSSTPSMASIGASIGIVTGVAVGGAVITYSVASCGATAYTTATVTVTPAPVNRISGHVLFTGSPIDSTGELKVWLIHYNTTTHMLTAVDSLSFFMTGTSIYYQFIGAVADSYRVKAAYFPAVFSSTGYVPTYHTSSFYWHSASVFAHSAPGIDDFKDITMAYGTVTTGPGFIAGDVTTGANKGTAGDAPAANMLIFALSSTGSIMQQTYTNSAGHYSFSNLPLGTYTIYPEAINYTTTAQTGITLTSGSPSMSSANFGQHTTPKTIRPKTVAVQNITAAETSVFAFPNPCTGKLNIQWNESANEKATLTVADVTGRIVYTFVINMTEGTGATQIDLSSLNIGIYTVSVKSANLNYNNKLQIQH